MDRSDRLHLVGKTTYYLGWISLLSGALVQLNIAKALFMAINLTKRNLFEASVALFIICVASEVRALVPVEKEMPSAVKRPVAA
jgi:hypothetical protein